ncbi:redoxin domain-containing protein [Gaoshiqia sediminis]|uniref:Redoxin domain-containing protein n=1 Tax=Gaoshiqia sediminis TaxID=2986998 RepID=A0AA41YCF9_9BACT|nr:redoxin domain-containing protein [Gaoshiqia sediminis]MCW0483908.1 redoxin domain-containing protein [Gaoshiqia sediminis]
MKKTLKKSWLSFKLSLLFVLPVVASGQGYSIRLSLSGHANSQVLVTYYYFGNIYVKDTLQTNPEGLALFFGSKSLQQGIYQLYFDQEKQVDFLVGQDQNFEISLENKTSSPQIKGAWESEKFQEYLNRVAEQKSRYDTITAKKEQYKNQPDSVSRYNQQLRKMNENLTSFRLEEGLKFADSFYGNFMTANQVPKPEENQLPAASLKNDSLRWVYEYNYRAKHYWDYFDLSDLRMWHTPYIKERLNNFLNKVLLQHPDTVLPAAIRLIEKHRNNKAIFQNLTSFILNNSIQSRIMGIENVFVGLAEKYYLSGQAFWVDAQTLDYIRQEVAIRKNNLMGNTASELLLEDANGEFHSLKQQATNYTVVAFWEPECGHCKTEIPRLYQEVFLKANPSNLSVYAVYTMNDKDSWLRFVEEHQIRDWLNVWDPHQSSNFRYLYGVRTTPSLFLLDKDKKIIAKNMDVSNLKQILSSLGVLQPE